VRAGAPAAEARARASAVEGATHLLLVDDAERPLGWLPIARLPGSGRVDASLAEAMSPYLDRRTTLKDALSMLLEAEVQNGIVVDRGGRLRGLLTVGAVIAWMRDDRSRSATDRSRAHPSHGEDDGA
jgi:CBS domain-containing protein